MPDSQEAIQDICMVADATDEPLEDSQDVCRVADAVVMEMMSAAEHKPGTVVSLLVVTAHAER